MNQTPSSRLRASLPGADRVADRWIGTRVASLAIVPIDGAVLRRGQSAQLAGPL